MFFNNIIFSYINKILKLERIIFLILFLGIFCIMLGIHFQNKSKEYLFKNDSYNIFRDRDALMKQRGFVNNYPWEDIQVNSKLVTFYNNPKNGFGKGVGFKYNL